MNTRTLAPTISLSLGLTFLLLHAALPVAQEAGGGDSFKPFVGTWKGICADGAEFIVLKLGSSGNEMAGTVSIANMSGPKGQCGAVIDPPTDEHAMKIHDAQLQGKTLAFKGAGQTAFEMNIAGDDDARLKFLGTPVESNPWKLKRAK
jgi:hypothetical protein